MATAAYSCVPMSDGIHVAAGRYTGVHVNRSVLVNDQWVAMKCNAGVVVVDVDIYLTIKDVTWSMNNNYPFNASNTYMHRVIAEAVGMDAHGAGLSVDHIDWIKTDNRHKNLRMATQAEQNSNRFARVDKKPACDALIEAGIDRLPRGIRWDASCGRYTCIDHVACKGKNSNGTRSGTDEVAKFKDCLGIYIAHLESDEQFRHDHTLGSVRAALAEEYNAIVRCAHAFDASMPDGPYAVIDDIVDDLTCAKRIMARLDDVQVSKGAPNAGWRDVVAPHGLDGVVGRIKGRTLTLYDERYRDRLGTFNWDVDGSAPRANKVPLASLVWTELAGRTVLDGHVVAAISRRAYDVRLENLELVAGRQGYRGTDDDWLVPHDVDIGMRFLPKGVTVNKSKITISQAGRLRPGEHGADHSGKWAKTVSANRDNIKALIADAIVCLKSTHGLQEFDASNVTYQRLLGEHIDACDALL
jgi:hypothetical protein